MGTGFVKLPRDRLHSGVLKNHKLNAFLDWCLLKAAYKTYDQTIGNQIVRLEPGQFVFGRKAAAKELKLHESTVYRYLREQKSCGFLDFKPNNKFTLVILIDWHTYKGRADRDEQQKNNKRTTNGHKIEDKKIIKNVPSANKRRPAL